MTSPGLKAQGVWYQVQYQGCHDSDSLDAQEMKMFADGVLSSSVATEKSLGATGEDLT
jgi:hypothetical protein